MMSKSRKIWLSNMKIKKILFITGTRADYGKIKTLMSIVETSPKYELHVFVTGMHLSQLHGSTYRAVQRDGWRNVHIDFASASHEEGMAQNLALIAGNLSNFIRALAPDLTVIHGDRIEALAGVISSTLQNIRTAHIEGGEVSGTIDESIRHAITKLSHEHFVSSENAKNRLLKLGEENSRIHVIGSPDIDVMLSSNLPSVEEVKKHYEITFQDYFIATLHPVTTDLFDLKDKAEVFVSSLIDCGRNGILIYPNNDLGHEIILSAYAKLLNNPQFKLFPSLRFEAFLTLLKNCQFIIGNSSAGIREAGIYGIPAIDIGNRQQGRYSINELNNLQHVEFNKSDILHAIEETKNYRYSSKLFGSGGSAGKFLEIIDSDEFWSRSIQKRLTY